MKKLTLLMAAVFICLLVSAQSDTTKTGPKADTIRIGKILIVKHGKNNDGLHITLGRKGRERKQNSNVKTSWWNVDIGISNYVDNTNYTSSGTYLVNRPGYPNLGKSDFSLNSGKSINVNIWVITQKISLIKNNLNLKYGLGMELNNYRYKTSLSYKEGGSIPYSANMNSTTPFIFRDSISFTKNKLAADYLTVPILLNFVSNPSISLSVGVSGGYLYSQRNKQKSSERGKQKNRGDYGLEKFKFSYIAELGIGSLRIYGSYSPNSMYGKGLDIKPYNLGFRLTDW